VPVLASPGLVYKGVAGAQQEEAWRDTGAVSAVQVLDSLGKGAFGKVKLCKDIDTDETFAIKIMDKTVLKKKRQGMSNMLESVMKEIAIMKKLNHVNCVRIFEVLPAAPPIHAPHAPPFRLR